MRSWPLISPSPIPLAPRSASPPCRAARSSRRTPCSFSNERGEDEGGKRVRRAAKALAAPARTAPEASHALLRAKLARLGIHRDFDLVLHLPLRYEDETRIVPIQEVPPGSPVQVEGTVFDSKIVFRPRRQLVVRIGDGGGEVTLRFFNFYPSQQKALAPGARLRAFGEVRASMLGGEMIHPRFHVLHGDEPLPVALTPIYPTTAGLSQGALRRMIGEALGRTSLDETLPEAT